jgi:di/tricarboxylate transporter
MESSGAASYIATAVLGLSGRNEWLALVAIYVFTMVMTEVLSNNAAAVLVFPFAMAAARALDVSPLPFVFAIMIAASCGFATPIGYQTNLMVYGPGGYHFRDYVLFGGPLNLLVAVVTVLLAPLVWPFR